jgi:multiple sugar transport system permease protein
MGSQATPAPTRDLEGTAGPKRRLARTDTIVLVLMLGIPTLVHVVVIWLPALGSVALSFTQWQGIGGLSTIEPVGLQNYRDIFTIYPVFWPAVTHNLMWLGFYLFIATPLGMFIAVLIDKELAGSRFYQSALYLPVVLSLAVIGIITQLVFSVDQGLVNNVLGITVNWLGDPSLNIWVVLIMASWRHVGYIMILYLAGLKGVDPTLKEAAQIDGASETQTFFRVVFPVLKPINIIILVITLIESLRAFDIPYIINKGRNGLEMLSILITDNIIGEASRIGFGSALAVILLVVALGVIIPYLFTTFRKDQGAA